MRNILAASPMILTFQLNYLLYPSELLFGHQTIENPHSNDFIGRAHNFAAIALPTARARNISLGGRVTILVTILVVDPRGSERL